MNFKNFLEKYNGAKNVGNTTQNMGQCVGLVAKWVDNLNAPHIWGDAYQLFVNADENYFEKIFNTPDAIPQEGDIIVWPLKFNGTAGHTGIAMSGCTIDVLKCFEQNDPLGSACHEKDYSGNAYLMVTGWLRPKQISTPSDDTLPVEKTVFEELVRKSSLYDKIREALVWQDNETIILADIEKLKTLENGLSQKDKQLSETSAKAAELQTLVTNLQTQLKGLTDDNQKLTLQIAEQEKTITNTTQAVTSLQSELSDLQSHAEQPVFTGLKLWLFNLLKKL
mgnify:CR=1 FL=1